MQLSKRKSPRRIDLSLKRMRIFLKIGRWLLTVAATAVLTVTLVTALGDRRMSDLSPEHRVVFEQEFTASQEPEVDWEAYRAIEDKLAVELGEKISSDDRSDSLVDRYSENSLTYPGNFTTNWNLSLIHISEPTRPTT